jgi:hypothetical protein
VKPWLRHALGAFLLLAAIAVVAVTILSLTFDPAWVFTPSQPFDATASAARPDHDEASAWLVLPSSPGNAALVPPGLVVDVPPQTRPAAFYVHPTMFFSRERWNAATDEPVSSELLEQVVVASQASVFARCCDVFAPRYRQATLGAYFAAPKDAQGAFELAWRDVSDAFDAFLRRIGPDRPYLLVAHSQGTMHALRLLQEVVATRPALARRLVAAYLVGYALPQAWLSDEAGQGVLRVCRTPTDTGCVVGWDSHRVGATLGDEDRRWYWRDGQVERVPAATPRVCSNPLTFDAEAATATAAHHLGAAWPQLEGEAFDFLTLLRAEAPLGVRVERLAPIHPHLFGARCAGGVLQIDAPAGVLDGTMAIVETAPGDLHLHDFELFYANVARNAVVRSRAHAAGRRADGHPRGDHTEGGVHP